jgi:hypothetical protein
MTYVYAQVDFGPDGNPPTLVIENADRSLVMSDATYTACASYLERLGAAEYRSFVAARRRKSERYAPTPYHAELVRLLGLRDESAFKSLKATEGYTSALGC